MKNDKYLKKSFGKYIEMNIFDIKRMLNKKKRKCLSIINKINNDQIHGNDDLIPLEALEIYKAYLYEFMNSNELYYTIYINDEDDFHYAARLKFTGSDIHLVTEMYDNPQDSKFHHHHINQDDIIRNIYEIHLNKEENNAKVKQYK